MSCPCSGLVSVISGISKMKEYVNFKNLFYSIVAICCVAYGSYVGYTVLNKKPIDTSAPVFIDNKEKYNVGDLITINIKHNTKYDKSSVVWKIFDGLNEKTDFRSCNSDGIYFGSGNQPKVLLVCCSINYLVDGEIKSYFLSTSVNIGNAPNPPNPNPNPNPPKPNPEPTFPDEKLGLSSFTWKAFNKHITVDNKVELATAYSKNFDSILSAMAAGAYKNKKVEDALVDLTRMNANSASTLKIPVAITDAFGLALQGQLVVIQNRDGAYNWPSIQRVFEEIREGLRAVR